MNHCDKHETFYQRDFCMACSVEQENYLLKENIKKLNQDLIDLYNRDLQR